jgi:hypothetical protein
MAHIADHQFVALLELVARDSSGEQVSDRREEGRVVRAEAPMSFGTDSKDAVEAIVAAGDRHANAARAAVPAQIGLGLEPRLAGEIVDDQRQAGIQRGAGVRVGFG